MNSTIASTGMAIKHGMEHRDGQGNLIYAEWTRPNDMANQYDEWRNKWCNKNRIAPTPEGLREGTITEENIQFALGKGYSPVFTIEQLTKILNMEV